MSLGKSTLREKSTLNLAVRKLFVSIDCYLMYLDFFFLVNNNIQDYLSLVGNIIALVNLDISVLEALIIEILLGKNLGTVEHIRSYLSALYHTQLLLHIFTLALLQTNIVDIRDTWTNRKIDMEIKLLTYDRVGSDSHLREESMFPVALYGIGNLVARHSNLVAHTEAGDTCENIVFIALNTRNVDTTNLKGTRCTCIRDIRVYDFILCLNLHACHYAEQQDENLFKSIHLYLIIYNMIFLCLYEVCLFLLLFHLCLGFSKSTLAVLITCYCLVQIFFIEVWPEGITEIQL